MIMGNMARDNGELIFDSVEKLRLGAHSRQALDFVRPLVGTTEVVNGTQRYCFWISSPSGPWQNIEAITERVHNVEVFRRASKAKTTNGYAKVPWRFAQCCHRDEDALVLPSVVPEQRAYVTPALLPRETVVTNLAYILYDFKTWQVSVLASLLHTAWAAAVSGRLGSGIRYTPSICYHTFPLPALSDQDEADLTRCAEDILLAREAYFPATIADMYDPERMDRDFPDLRAAHERNDETLERIYIGRRFRNDTERLEHLFALYTKMTASDAPAGDKAAKKPRAKRSQKAA